MTIEDTWGGDIITAAIAHLAHSTPPELLFSATDANITVTRHCRECTATKPRPPRRFRRARLGYSTPRGRIGRSCLCYRGRLVLPKTSPAYLLTGFVTNFFDTLGIGSFATTTAIFKFKNMVPDELIPGTLNVGHALPVIFQAFIFVSAIKVDVATLLLMILAAVVGAWFGAGFVVGLPRRTVQIGVAAALLTGGSSRFTQGSVSSLSCRWHLVGINGLALSRWRRRKPCLRRGQHLRASVSMHPV